MIYIKSLSEATGCEIYGKAEWLNPSGSIKDRAAKQIILEAEANGTLVRGKGFTIVEATGGNTGISLAAMGAALGYNVVLTMPDCISEEKVALARRFGSKVLLQPLVPFTDPENYAKKAESLGSELPNAIYTNQFQNLANYRAHYTGTAPEIWKQLNTKIDVFICAAGTGGTLAGISSFLKEASGDRVKCFLIDPIGSVLFNHITKNEVSVTTGKGSFIEGIGIGRIVENFKKAKLDGAFQGDDLEAVNMIYYLMRNEGICIGPSAALNLVGAVKVAKKMGPGHTICTVLCDAGERYSSKVFNKGWLKEQDLNPTSTAGYDLSFIANPSTFTAPSGK